MIDMYSFASAALISLDMLGSQRSTTLTVVPGVYLTDRSFDVADVCVCVDGELIVL